MAYRYVALIKYQNDLYVALIKYQNDLIAKFLGLDVENCQDIWRQTCSYSFHLFSTSISFHVKLWDAILFVNDPVHVINFAYYKAVYRAIMKAFYLHGVKSPVDKIYIPTIGLS